MLRQDITAVRAIAVLLVVLFHFKIRGFAGGFVGVDIFFVVSGYLMTRIITTALDAGRFGYWAFLGMRVARIMPALLTLIGVLLCLGSWLLAPPDFQRFGEQALSAILFVSNLFYRQGPGYFTTATDERWLLHTWSLSVEWQFYVAYPLVLLAVQAIAARGAGTSARLLWRLRFGALTLLLLASLGESVVRTRTDQSAAFFLLTPRAWEMLAGSLVLLLEGRAAALSATLRRALRWAGIALILGGCWLAGRHAWEAQWPGALALWPVLGTVAVLLAGAASPAPGWMRIGVVQKIGLWSYSIYLWHWPLVVSMNWLDIDNEMKRYAKGAAIVASTVLGAASHRWIESRFKFDKRRAALQTGVVAPLLLSLGLLGASQLVVASEGWMQRVAGDAAYYRKFSRVAAADIYPAACGNYQKRRQDLTLCRINADATGPRTLVYGDSHAEHLYPWFARRAVEGVDFLAGSGCPPVPGFNRRDAGFRCDEFAAFAVELARDARYAVVVVAGNWGNGMDQVPSTLCQVRDGSCGAQDPPAARDALIEANARVWAGLIAQGKTLVVVDQTPQARFDVMTLVMRRRFLGLAPVAGFDDVRPPGTGPSTYIDDVLARLPQSPRLHRVSLRSAFCVGSRCQTVDSRTQFPILKDRSHFVPDWIEQHGGAFGSYVRAR